VGKSTSDFASWNSSSELQDLFSNGLVDFFWLVLVKQVIVHLVSSSDNFGFLEMVGLECLRRDSNVVHVGGKDLVSVDVVTPQSTVRVGKVVAVLNSNIDQFSENSVNGIVLLLCVI